VLRCAKQIGQGLGSTPDSAVIGKPGPTEIPQEKRKKAQKPGIVAKRHHLGPVLAPADTAHLAGIKNPN
jgi:hypothetical protein